MERQAIFDAKKVGGILCAMKVRPHSGQRCIRYCGVVTADVRAIRETDACHILQEDQEQKAMTKQMRFSFVRYSQSSNVNAFLSLVFVLTNITSGTRNALM